MPDPIREAIVAKLQNVPGIGRVQAYQRYSDDLASLSDFYMDGDGLLLGWYVRRVSVDEGRIGKQTPEVTKWEIVGFRAVVDADESELLFNDLIDAVRAAFRDDAWPSLGRDVHTRVGEGESGIQVKTIEHVVFGAGVLCHSATLGLTVHRYR